MELVSLLTSIALVLGSCPATATAQENIDGEGSIFQFGNASYFANTLFLDAILTLSGNQPSRDGPVTVIQTNVSTITAAVLESTLRQYAEDDDVYSVAFLGAVLLKTSNAATMDPSALDYLTGMGTTHVMIDGQCHAPAHNGTKSITYNGTLNLPPGPYLCSYGTGTISLSKVYRLYEDLHRDFLYGTYPLGDGTARFTSLDISVPQFGYPAIPVPSRIYSWGDPRPFAGFRVAVKDLFDISGLVTTGGSQAWGLINPRANETAPSIQRIVDLGGVVVGKYKLAQFASGADPWMWQDEHPPFNPRGDGWLSCSASSSGGGCSIAAYEWLDFAIGSDTGESMRLPAAVSGTYAQRPSQGMISLDRVMPVGGATDTAGVFSRDPYRWIHFAKHWYTPALHESPNITGLSPLEVPDTNAFPKTILYPIDFLPLNNSAAQPILDDFIESMSSLFGMQVKRFNFSATVASSAPPGVSNLTELNDGMMDVINSHTQYEAVGRKLLSQWSEMFDGRFPPIDSARRQMWHDYNETKYSTEAYNDAVRQKRAAVEWYETDLQYSTPESCSESVMLYDIGPGGLPSYREEKLNNNANASFLDLTPEGATIPGSSICPVYGCADFTIPLGQVPYWSEVTYHSEMVPVTINMVVKRGCDFVCTT